MDCLRWLSGGGEAKPTADSSGADMPYNTISFSNKGKIKKKKQKSLNSMVTPSPAPHKLESPGETPKPKLSQIPFSRNA